MTNIQTVRPENLRRDLEEGRPLMLIDVRTPAEFEAVHARGAQSMPLDRFDAAAIKAARNGDSEPIYLICQSGSRSADAARRLARAGLDRVFSVEGGTRAWQAAGLPVVRGQSRAISMERQVRIAAGVLVLAGVVASGLVNLWFILITAFVGVGLIFSGVTDFCGMAIVLGKMPWNRRVPDAGARACDVGRVIDR
jgi:rhodanese-related sulfurtransferase